MDITYKKFPPKEIFISFIGREAKEEELWLGFREGIVYHKPTGNEFLDLFAKMVHRYMNHQPRFYARLLGVTAAELSGCLMVLSGLPAEEWITAYRWLAIRDLLLHTDWPLAKLAERTGYSSLKTFSRAFIKRVGIPPSHWRKKYKGKG
ncbi:MAG: AraC family transcriptional regulator [Parabacteroides sp.]|nr:AraC family transcriptional regulator [Parabacteroides sp.]